MIDTAVTQLRFGFSLVLCRRIGPADVRRLARDMLASRAEFGPDAVSRSELPSATVDPDVRRALDERRLRRTAQLAYDTRYYRALFDDLGLSPGKLSLGRLADIPPTPKSALKTAPEAFVNAGSTPVFQAFTTGTTGTPTSVWFSRYELELAAALSAVAFLVDPGLVPEDVVQINLSSRANLAVSNVLQACRIIGTAAYPVGLVDPDEALVRLRTRAALPGKATLPSVLVTHPSYLGALVQRAEDLGCEPDELGLKHLICSGEPLTEGLRRRAQAAFGATVTETYAMTEIFPSGGLVCSEQHLHLTPEQGYVEVLDADGVPVPAGAVGELVVTPLFPYRDTTILLRLATGDLVRQLDQQAIGCELAGLPATSRILGKGAATDEDVARNALLRAAAEVLEGESRAPLPARYTLEDAGGRLTLHVVAPNQTAIIERLHRRAADVGLDVRILAHDGPAALPGGARLRCDLREQTFTRPAVNSGAAA